MDSASKAYQTRATYSSGTSTQKTGPVTSQYGEFLKMACQECHSELAQQPSIIGRVV